jgi:hypothetical protein
VGAGLSPLGIVFVDFAARTPRRASSGLRALPLIALLIYSFNFIPSYAIHTSTLRSTVIARIFAEIWL